MGWLSMRSMGGHATPQAYLDAQFTWRNEGVASRVLRSSVVGRSTYYAAIEHVLTNDGARTVFAVICLIKYTPRARDGYIFAYKDMDETVSPYRSECPVAIIDLLTPTECPHSLAWRADCRKNLERQQAAAKKRPKIGQILVLRAPVLFRDGQTLSRFRVVKLPRRRGFVYLSLEAGGLYRIPNIGRRDFIIEDTGRPVAS